MLAALQLDKAGEDVDKALRVRSEVILKKRLTSRSTLQVTGDEEDYWIKKTDLQEGSAID